MKKIFAIILALFIPFAVSAESVTVKVGVVGENTEQWEQLIIPTLEKEGIHIELVKFSDYIVPNQALLTEGDLNAFQHKISLKTGTKLQAATLSQYAIHL